MAPDHRAPRSCLEITGLNAFYGKSQVLFDVALNVGRGEIVALLGRNGAGKTSTLMAVAGLISAEATSLALERTDLTRLPAYRRVRAGVSLVPSGSRGFGDLTVEENLRLVYSRNNGPRRFGLADVYGLFPALEPLRNSKASSLSGGERQMLAVGRALLTAPSLLLLDEPSGGLAPLVVRELGRQIRELSEEGLAVLVTEQNHVLAVEIASRVYFIEKGFIAWEGPSSEASRGDILMRYLGV